MQRSSFLKQTEKEDNLFLDTSQVFIAYENEKTAPDRAVFIKGWR